MHITITPPPIGMNAAINRTEDTCLTFNSDLTLS